MKIYKGYAIRNKKTGFWVQNKLHHSKFPKVWSDRSVVERMLDCNIGRYTIYSDYTVDDYEIVEMIISEGSHGP